MASILERLDTQLGELFAGWSIYTTVLVLVIGVYLVYPLIFYAEPDIHPFLLARQSQGSRVRQPGESSTYRAHETPQGYPLRSGLNVKDPGQPKWTAGRDGDLRDVWRRACSGPPEGDDDLPKDAIGLVKTVLGKEEVLDHTFEQLSKEINALGKHLQSNKSTRVAIYLSNSVELLVALIAATFYNLTPILIAQEQSVDRLSTILEKTKADALIVGAGSVPLNALVKKYQGLNQVIWVVSRSSRHLDWDEVSEGEGGKADISTWHDVVDEEGSFASPELPASEPNSQAPDIILVSEPTDHINDYEIVEFSQRNLVSAIAAQLVTLPRPHRLSTKDILLPLAPLTNTYPLILTLTVLYCNCTLALTSVTGPTANYTSAFHGVSPSIIILDPMSLYNYELKRRSLLRNGIFAAQRHQRLLSRLAKGIIPPNSGMAFFGEGSPRLVYSWGVCAPETLCNFRVFTGARVVMALTDPHVAGAVSQTNLLDYRQLDNLGPPLSSVEVKLTEVPGRNIDGDEPQGKLVVTGPAVVGGEAIVDSIVKITESATLAYGEPLPDRRDLPVPDIAEHIEHALASPVAS